MKATESTTANPTYWQLIFLQSKVNGASYNDQYFDTSFGGWVNPNTFNPIAPPNVAIGEAYIFQTTLGPINWNQSLPSQ